MAQPGADPRGKLLTEAGREVDREAPPAVAPPPAPARRRWPERLGDLGRPGGLLLVAALAVAAIAVTTAERDPDFWWHLRTGQLLIANHLQLLGNDPYTYTVPTHHWTMHEWLFEVGIYALYGLAGIGLIVLALSMLTLAGFVALVARARLHTRSTAIIGIAVIVAAITGYPIWGPRDQMIDFAFSCALLLIVERYLVRGGRILWILPPFFLLWSNLHGGFVIGLAFLALIAAAEAVGVRLGTPEPAPLRRVGWVAATAVACTLVSMVNPNGPGILLYAWGTVSSPAQQALILEWQSPNFHMEEVRTFAVMLVSLAALVMVNRRMRAREVVVVAATAVLALESVRNIALFVAVATPIWAEQLSLVVARIQRGSGSASARVTMRAHRQGSGRPRAGRPRRFPPTGMRVAVMGIVTCLLTGGYVGFRLVPAMAASTDSLATAQTFPVCAAQWLRSAPAGLRIFNQYGEGGYLAWSLAGTGDKIFIFGDAALMGDNLLYTYTEVIDAQPGWETILERYRTQVVLFDTGTPLDQVLRASPRWRLVYHDPLSDAFVLSSQAAALHLPPQPPTPSGVCAQLAAAGLPSASP
jgi:hypothetical protein